jgi:hypothetical protein
VTQEASGMFEGLDRLRLLAWFPHNADEDLCMAQVSANLNMGNAGEPDTWIFHTCPQQIAQFCRDEFA